jgi:hypothetical protein
VRNIRQILLSALTAAVLGTAAHAQVDEPLAQAGTNDRVLIGKVRMFNNDALGDFQDRWRTGSYGVSHIYARDWTGGATGEFGDVWETRLRSEIIAPSNLSDPNIGTDRRYVGILSVGRHTHFERNGREISLGADLVFTGPMTGMGGFQTWAHNLIGAPKPQVLGSQIGNSVRPTFLLEVGKSLSSDGNSNVEVRPFAEMQAGVETFIRVGADVTFGSISSGGIRLRDVVTGQRSMPAGESLNEGTLFTIGADIAKVFSSNYLPSTSGYTLTNFRPRVRAGFTRATNNKALFYGLTWLGKEFTNQTDTQLVGSLSLRLKF